MNLKFLAWRFDERFLIHRLRSTSTAGIVSTTVALLLFMWHVWVDHVWSWELLSIGITNVVIKLSMMTFYALRD